MSQEDDFPKVKVAAGSEGHGSGPRDQGSLSAEAAPPLEQEEQAPGVPFRASRLRHREATSLCCSAASSAGVGHSSLGELPRLRPRRSQAGSSDTACVSEPLPS